MKVGDIVRQNNRLIGVRGGDGKTIPPPKTLGTVISIQYPDDEGLSGLKDWQKKWFDKLGGSVTVLWSSGRVSENVAEHALDIICEQNEDD